MRTVLTLSILSLSILALGGCFFDDDSNPATAGGTASNGDWDTVFSVPTVQLTASQVVSAYPQATNTYCDNSSGTTLLRSNTVKAHLDTVPYRIVGDRLMELKDDTLRIGTTGRALQYAIYDRISGSAGSILGTWALSFQDSLQPLNISETDSAFLARKVNIAAKNAALKDAGLAGQMTFTQDQITFRLRSGNWAKQYLLAWRDYDAGRYFLTVAAIDANTVTIASSTETVTMRKLDGDRVQYSSTDRQHPTYVHNDHPGSVAQCPEEWFGAFLQANIRGII